MNEDDFYKCRKIAMFVISLMAIPLIIVVFTSLPVITKATNDFTARDVVEGKIDNIRKTYSNGFIWKNEIDLVTIEGKEYSMNYQLHDLVKIGYVVTAEMYHKDLVIDKIIVN